MEATRYLLDMAVVAELTRPNGNRRVFTLFAQRQSISALAAPVVFKLLQGVDTLPEGQRRTQLAGFVAELLRSGPPVLPFDREAALWLARETPRRRRLGRPWSVMEGQLAAIAGARELILVTRVPAAFAGTGQLVTEDWFRP